MCAFASLYEEGCQNRRNISTSICYPWKIRPLCKEKQHVGLAHGIINMTRNPILLHSLLNMNIPSEAPCLGKQELGPGFQGIAEMALLAQML